MPFAVVLLALAARVYLGRFAQLFDDRGGAIFSGVAYTDAHVTLTGMLFVAVALVAGAVIALVNAVVGAEAALAGRGDRAGRRLLRRSSASLAAVRQQLHREAERARARAAVHRAQHRVDAAGVRPRPASCSSRFRPSRASRRSTSANNQATLQNIRLWDWRALQDTLRQIQAIRTYYEFPDVDIDRYVIDGKLRQMMVAARELNVDRLPESSRELDQRRS